MSKGNKVYEHTIPWPRMLAYLVTCMAIVSAWKILRASPLGLWGFYAPIEIFLIVFVIGAVLWVVDWLLFRRKV